MRSSQPFALRPSPAPPAARALASPPLASTRGAVATARSAPSVLLPPSSAAQAGLPQLASLAASCTVDPARTLPPHAHSSRSAADATCASDDDAAAIGIVDMFGDVSSRESIRATLLRFYEDTHQVRARAAATTKAVAPTDSGVLEMTLRIDTELELLRQQCFAERNAQWDYHTPDMFEYEPASEPLWTPQLIGNTSIAMQRLKHDAPTERDEREAIAAAVASGSYAGVAAPGVGGAVTKVDGKGFPLGQLSRERPWPPREFTQKAAVRPVRGRGGKRKVPVVVFEERSVFSKICSECQTQATPLWRKLARDGDTWVPVTKSDAPVSEPATAQADDPAATTAPALETAAPSVPALPVFDVCLACFLKLQRGDLFARKTLERDQRVRERKERVAHAALLEKKRLKQQLQLLKKQQQQTQTQSKSKKRRPSVVHDPTAAAAVAEELVVKAPAAPLPMTLKLVVKTTDLAHDDPLEDQVDEPDQYEARPRVYDGNDEYDLPPSNRSSASKRERKKSKKSKKEKKKKKRRRVEPVDSDAESDCSTPMPSPPQMVGQYEYADRSDSERTRSGRAAASLSFDTEDAVYEQDPVPESPPHRRTASSKARATDESVEVASRARKTSSRSSESSSKALGAVTVTTATSSSNSSTTGASPPPTSSSSKSRKRKSSIAPPVAPVAVAMDDAGIERTKSTARLSRTKATPAAPAPVPTPLASAARKRTRIKKESARERELRALGQYCPVCNAVYEEDDESTFVCCDSCEMWVHGSCDTTLTPASIAALADSSEKYICPLCAGR